MRNLVGGTVGPVGIGEHPDHVARPCAAAVLARAAAGAEVCIAMLVRHRASPFDGCWPKVATKLVRARSRRMTRLCGCVTACNRHGRLGPSEPACRRISREFSSSTTSPRCARCCATGLEGEGFAVVEAADGRQAMALIESLPIDLVTLDLKLGGEDGLKVARDLRTVKEHADDHDHRQGRCDRPHRRAGARRRRLHSQAVSHARGDRPHPRRAAPLYRGGRRPGQSRPMAGASATASTAGSSICRAARCASPKAPCAS